MIIELSAAVVACSILESEELEDKHNAESCPKQYRILAEMIAMLRDMCRRRHRTRGDQREITVKLSRFSSWLDASTVTAILFELEALNNNQHGDAASQCSRLLNVPCSLDDGMNLQASYTRAIIDGVSEAVGRRDGCLTVCSMVLSKAALVDPAMCRSILYKCSTSYNFPSLVKAIIRRLMDNGTTKVMSMIVNEILSDEQQVSTALVELVDHARMKQYMTCQRISRWSSSVGEDRTDKTDRGQLLLIRWMVSECGPEFKQDYMNMVRSQWLAVSHQVDIIDVAKTIAVCLPHFPVRNEDLMEYMEGVQCHMHNRAVMGYAMVIGEIISSVVEVPEKLKFDVEIESDANCLWTLYNASKNGAVSLLNACSPPQKKRNGLVPVETSDLRKEEEEACVQSVDVDSDDDDDDLIPYKEEAKQRTSVSLPLTELIDLVLKSNGIPMTDKHLKEFQVAIATSPHLESCLGKLIPTLLAQNNDTGLECALKLGLLYPARTGIIISDTVFPVMVQPRNSMLRALKYMDSLGSRLSSCAVETVTATPRTYIHDSYDHLLEENDFWSRKHHLTQKSVVVRQDRLCTSICFLLEPSLNSISNRKVLDSCEPMVVSVFLIHSARLINMAKSGLLSIRLLNLLDRWPAAVKIEAGLKDCVVCLLLEQLPDREKQSYAHILSEVRGEYKLDETLIMK